MFKLLLILLIGIVYTVLHYQANGREQPLPHDSAQLTSSKDVVAQAYERHQSRVQVSGEGVVERILPDDNQGARHQRMILRTPSGISLLIAHNIDLAPRIEGVKIGDALEFSGEYEWNAKGGVVHWTHHDPQGRHVGGWLRRRGQIYQ